MDTDLRIGFYHCEFQVSVFCIHWYIEPENKKQKPKKPKKGTKSTNLQGGARLAWQPNGGWNSNPCREHSLSEVTGYEISKDKFLKGTQEMRFPLVEVSMDEKQ
jgi:hypothetical protein